MPARNAGLRAFYQSTTSAARRPTVCAEQALVAGQVHEPGVPPVGTHRPVSGTGPHDRVLVAADGAVLELCSKDLRGADDLFATVESPIPRALWFELPED